MTISEEQIVKYKTFDLSNFFEETADTLVGQQYCYFKITYATPRTFKQWKQFYIDRERQKKTQRKVG